MESAELVDMMINGASPSEMQDAVKDLLIMKAADKVCLLYTSPSPRD